MFWPATGASSTFTPRSRAASATRAPTAVELVLMSIDTEPGSIAAITPSRSSTCSTSGGALSIVITASAPAAQSTDEDPARAPASTARASASPFRS